MTPHRAFVWCPICAEDSVNCCRVADHPSLSAQQTGKHCFLMMPEVLRENELIFITVFSLTFLSAEDGVDFVAPDVALNRRNPRLQYPQQSTSKASYYANDLTFSISKQSFYLLVNVGLKSSWIGHSKNIILISVTLLTFQATKD